MCSTQLLAGQSFSNYRQFELGSGVAVVSEATATAVSDTKTIHQRPAVLQELDWRPSRWTAGANAASTDPVDRIVFSFYNDRLFRIVVDYGTQWTEGMTPPDLVEGISTVYGTPLVGAARNTGQAASQIEIESGSPVARWGDTGHTVVLYRTASYRGTFRLVVTDLPVAGLASKAQSEARRLDDREAPQRELLRQQKARDDEREAAAKARLANKNTFHP
jgi:hypothetical protein